MKYFPSYTGSHFDMLYIESSVQTFTIQMLKGTFSFLPLQTITYLRDGVHLKILTAAAELNL